LQTSRRRHLRYANEQSTHHFWLCLTTRTSLSPIWRGFAPGFVSYKKGCTWLAVASDKVYQLPAHGRWFSTGTPASSTTKTGCHDIAESGVKTLPKKKIIILLDSYIRFFEQWCSTIPPISIKHIITSHVKPLKAKKNPTTSDVEYPDQRLGHVQKCDRVKPRLMGSKLYPFWNLTFNGNVFFFYISQM
jgi:hypothetical protein